ncbi:hypothetical protein T492DRAFT_411403 [Pavlovales sp. CCMP2436]|nr:hypothetical protein T492DRAFT_411403 [Pavlovales sp. CCMP2436]
MRVWILVVLQHPGCPGEVLLLCDPDGRAQLRDVQRGDAVRPWRVRQHVLGLLRPRLLEHKAVGRTARRGCLPDARAHREQRQPAALRAEHSRPAPPMGQRGPDRGARLGRGGRGSRGGQGTRT